MDTRPRIEIPAFREPPPDVVRDLRLVESDAELVYLGEGAWYLGTVRKTDVRRRAGERKVRIALSTPVRLDEDRAKYARLAWMYREGLLLLEGFAGYQIFHGDPDSRIAEYLRRRHYTWARDVDRVLAWHHWQETYAAQAAEAEDEAEVEALRSTLFNEKRLLDAYRHAFRRPVSVSRLTHRDSSTRPALAASA